MALLNFFRILPLQPAMTNVKDTISSLFNMVDIVFVGMHMLQVIDIKRDQIANAVVRMDWVEYGETLSIKHVVIEISFLKYNLIL